MQLLPGNFSLLPLRLEYDGRFLVLTAFPGRTREPWFPSAVARTPAQTGGREFHFQGDSGDSGTEFGFRSLRRRT
jgi:hypothetical protein